MIFFLLFVSIKSIKKNSDTCKNSMDLEEIGK
jgi:hypothetical protein